MIRPFFEEEEYSGIDFTTTPLTRGEYDNCEFTNCQFAGTDLSDYTFFDCLFKDCDLSTSVLKNTTLSNVRFLNCKLLGLQFEQCHEFMFSVRFESCQLNLSSFFKRKVKKGYFKDCQLEEVDFSEADLKSCSFINCDLKGAIFDHTNLESADFRTAINYLIDADQNKLKKAQFSLQGLPGLLSKYDLRIEV